MKKPEPLKIWPRGFSSYATSCGIKDKTLDLGIVYSQKPAVAAAMFTKNKVTGKALIVGKDHIKDHQIQALIVNSKNANVATGKEGLAIAKEICAKLASELDIKSNLIFPSSTGVIGRRLPVENILASLNNIKKKLLDPPDFEKFSKCIMTTDSFPKFIATKVGSATLVAVAKGSGMIEPNMATMLSYFFTDARITAKKLESMLKRVVDVTYNSLSIDTDTSTSDTVLAMANGEAGRVDEIKFEKALHDSALALTRWLAIDAEGATKLFIVNVKGAKNNIEAKKVAKSVINSPLVKTAIYQGDPNWGRLMMAIGKTEDVALKPDLIKIGWGSPMKVYSNDELDLLSQYLKKNQELIVTIDLGIKNGSSTVYGCDLTEEYVRINAYYTT